MKRLALCIMYALLMISCSVQQNSGLNDLNFIYNAILENHPGVHNEEDSDFCENLENSYARAKSEIEKSRSNSSSKKAISDFTESFNDTHLSVRWSDKIAQMQSNKTSNFSIAELANDVVWITLPTFDLSGSQERDFREFLKQLSGLQNKKYIILDLRGNQGGNSEYGSEIINALFGNEYANLKRCLYSEKVFVDWRASQGNVSHISSLLARYPNSQWLQNVKRGLEESLQKGDLFYREGFSESSRPLKSPAFESKCSIKVIVIIDSVNVSAALDFIDELKIMTKNIQLVGQKTKADRVYMEVRSLPLPSGSGQFFFPIKVYRNRLRLDNESYVPE